MIPSRPVIQRPRTKGKTKKVKLPPPTRLLFGHAVVDGKVVPVLSTTAGTVEHHAMQNGVLKAHFDAAKAMRKWPNGAEVSEEAFLAAIKAVAEVKVGGFLSGPVAKPKKPEVKADAAKADAVKKTEVPPPAAKASAAKSEAK